MCLARNQNASSVSLHSYLDLSDLKSKCRFRLIIRFMEYEYELNSFANAPNLGNRFSKLNERFKFIWFFWWLIILYLWFHYLLGAKVSTIIFCEVSLRLLQSIDLNILELSWWSSTLPCTTFPSISSSSRLCLLLHLIIINIMMILTILVLIITFPMLISIIISIIVISMIISNLRARLISFDLLHGAMKVGCIVMIILMISMIVRTMIMMTMMMLMMTEKITNLHWGVCLRRPSAHNKELAISVLLKHFLHISWNYPKYTLTIYRNCLFSKNIKWKTTWSSSKTILFLIYYYFNGQSTLSLSVQLCMCHHHNLCHHNHHHQHQNHCDYNPHPCPIRATPLIPPAIVLFNVKKTTIMMVMMMVMMMMKMMMKVIMMMMKMMMMVIMMMTKKGGECT